MLAGDSLLVARRSNWNGDGGLDCSPQDGEWIL